MKKRAKAIEIKLPPAGLFVDDVEEIVKALGELGQTVSVAHADYALDSAGELIDLRSEIGKRYATSLRISASAYAMDWVDFDAYGSEIHLSQDDALHRGVAGQIVEIVRRRRKLLSPSRVLLLFLILSVVVWFAVDSELRYLLAAATQAVGWTCLVKNIPAHSVIYLNKRSADVPFFERYGDRIVTAAISAVVGGAVAQLFSRLL